MNTQWPQIWPEIAIDHWGLYTYVHIMEEGNMISGRVAADVSR